MNLGEWLVVTLMNGRRPGVIHGFHGLLSSQIRGYWVVFAYLELLYKT
jgi:hypothetical protein